MTLETAYRSAAASDWWAKTEIVTVGNLQGMAYKFLRNSQYIFQELCVKHIQKIQRVPADTMQHLNQSA